MSRFNDAFAGASQACRIERERCLSKCGGNTDRYNRFRRLILYPFEIPFKFVLEPDRHANSTDLRGHSELKKIETGKRSTFESPNFGPQTHLDLEIFAVRSKRNNKIDEISLINGINYLLTVLRTSQVSIVSLLMT